MPEKIFKIDPELITLTKADLKGIASQYHVRELTPGDIGWAWSDHNGRLAPDIYLHDRMIFNFKLPNKNILDYSGLEFMAHLAEHLCKHLRRTCVLRDPRVSRALADLWDDVKDAGLEYDTDGRIYRYVNTGGRERLKFTVGEVFTQFNSEAAGGKYEADLAVKAADMIPGWCRESVLRLVRVAAKRMGVVCGATGPYSTTRFYFGTPDVSDGFAYVTYVSDGVSAYSGHGVGVRFFHNPYLNLETLKMDIKFTDMLAKCSV